MALVITEMISDLHLIWKLFPRPVKATSPKYRDGLFSSVTKSNIELKRWNLGRTLVLWHN